jgi:hypothetical protein|uniref:Uncharacterized protein n=1 Tax=viral metagenome TaxID=1070528 RepID=A0A6C0J3P2_9ZZZZ
METLMSMIDDIKEKISSEEYKNLVDQIAAAKKDEKEFKEFSMEYTVFCPNCEDLISKIISFPKTKIVIRVCEDNIRGCCMGEFLSHLTMTRTRVEAIQKNIDESGYCTYQYTHNQHESIVYSLIFSKA